MKLSQNFSLNEFTKSQTATRHNIDNTPSMTIILNLTSLCESVLQPIRNHFMKPMIISSGYRCEELNTKIGGSKTSQHVLGQASDIEVLGVSNLELSDWIHINLDYDQLILEFYNKHEYKEAFKNEQGKTRYRLR